MIPMKNPFKKKTEGEVFPLEIKSPAVPNPVMRKFDTKKERLREIKKVVLFYYQMEKCKEIHVYKLEKNTIRITVR